MPFPFLARTHSKNSFPIRSGYIRELLKRRLQGSECRSLWPRCWEGDPGPPRGGLSLARRRKLSQQTAKRWFRSWPCAWSSPQSVAGPQAKETMTGRGIWVGEQLISPDEWIQRHHQSCVRQKRTSLPHGGTVSLDYYFSATFPYLQLKNISEQPKGDSRVALIHVHFVKSIVFLEKADLLHPVRPYCHLPLPLLRFGWGSQTYCIIKSPRSSSNSRNNGPEWV